MLRYVSASGTESIAYPARSERAVRKLLYTFTIPNFPIAAGMADWQGIGELPVYLHDDDRNDSVIEASLQTMTVILRPLESGSGGMITILETLENNAAQPSEERFEFRVV